VKDDELSALRNALDADCTEAARLLRALLDRPHEQTGHFLDVCLDRLIDDPLTFTEAQRTGLLQALAEIMDDVERITQQVSTKGHNEIWERTRFILRKHPPPDFLSTIRTGKSINWLTYVVRDQGFALGRPEGSRAYPENVWLQQPQFDEAVRILTTRLEAIGMKDVFSLPAPLDVLFFWAQLGNPHDVKVRFAEATKTHSEFLAALGSICGWGNRSDIGVYHPLYAKYVAYFGNPDEVYARLQRLAQARKSKHQPVARKLLAAWVSLQEGG
jgi:hypothetical protein